MMSFDSICERLNAAGYRKGTAYRNDESGLNIIDFSHRKRDTIFSLFVNSLGSVEYVEQTKLKWDYASKRYAPVVTKINNLKDLIRILA